MRIRFTRTLLLSLSVALAACGGQPEAETVEQTPTEVVAEPMPTEASIEAPAETMPGMLPAVNPLEVTGDIIAAGSSTVYPLAERMAERFYDEGFAGTITIDSIGSGAGFERFCVAGETDISNASRAIKDAEVESCKAIGREPIEFRIGTDALAVVVSSENDFIQNATVEELAAIFATADTWSDVNPAWPVESIERFIPGTDSGTFDYFVEEVYAEDEAPILGASPQMSEDDNVLVQGVEGSPYAIGFFGYAYYEENADKLRALSIEGVEPTQATVDAAEYPLARPLYMYSTATIMQDKPQVGSFLNFLLTNVDDEIIDVGYFPAPDSAIEEAEQKWLDANGMGSGAGAGESMLPAVNPLEVSGDIIAAGSSTVYPLAERMAERFYDEGFAGTITIDSIGSGAGFERFCVAGETDISNASRAIKDAEVESCKAIGREPIEFRIGTDALAVVVSSENDFIQNATVEELAAIFATADTWSDVNPAWPVESIERFIPGTDSGTFDYFVEEVYAEDEAPILGASPQMSEDDNVLVQGVEGSPYAIGFFGYAYYEENADKLRALSIEGVEPTQATVDAAEYPLARPLYMYTTATIMQSKPQVAAFLNFLLTNVDDEIIDVGYFPAPDSALEEAGMKWLDATR